MAPWIGMPAQMDPGSDRLYLDRHYTDAILAAGGIPLIIPLSETSDSITEIAERMNGILLTGNDSDMDPALYNAPRSSACGPAQPLRDQMDLFLLRIALKRKIPVLAICFGIQSLNAFFGGTLIQDIPTSIDAPIRHNNPDSKGFPSHEVKISSGSILEQIAGGLKIVVNSTHHQAIENPGHGLEVIASAPDGIVESVSCTNPNHCILGVQWHPEKSFAYDDFSRKLFRYFLACCWAARGSDEGTHT